MSDIATNNKRIAKNTIALYVRMLFTMCISLYTSRIVLNTLGEVDYGIYNVVGGVVVMFSFLNSAMSSSTSRYITFEIGKGCTKQLRNVFVTSVNIHTLIALIILILGETIGLGFLYEKLVIPSERLNAAFWVYQFSILSMVIMIMSVPYNALIIAHERMSAFAYISVLEVLLKLGVVYILCLTQLDHLIVYAFLLCLIQVVIRLIYGVYCRRHFQESKYKCYWNKFLFKEMLGFAGWNLFGNFSSVLSTQGMNILLNIFFGPVVNSARAIAVRVQSVISGFVSNFLTAVSPQITKSYAIGDIAYMENLVFKTSKLSSLLMFILGLPIFIEMEQILEIWLIIVPKYTTDFCRMMLLITLIDAPAYSLMISIQATGHVKKYQVFMSSIIIMILPISYIILNITHNPISAFIVHLFIAIVAQIYRIYWSQKLVKFSAIGYFRAVYYPLLKVILLSIILPLCIYFLMNVSFVRLMVVFVVSCVCTIAVSYIVGLTKSEKSLINNYIKKIL